MNLKKTLPTRVKAVDGEGTFEAIVSVFGNIDSYNDVVMPGAFANTLAKWAESGDSIPVVWSHQIGDPWSHLGVVLEAKETESGLWVKGQLDLDNPTAQQVFRLLKARRVKEFSFGYRVVSSSRGEKDGSPVNELRELDLIEVSPTLVGANPATELLDVKAEADVEIKAGRVLSAANEALLRTAHEALGALLSAVEPAADQPKADAGPAANDEEPIEAKSEELPAKASAMEADELQNLLHTIELERTFS